MTKALIMIGALLGVACGQAAAPAPRVSQTLAPADEPGPVAAAAPTAPMIETQDELARADAEDRSVIAELERALQLYREFIARAGDDPIYAAAVARSKERIADISDTLIFLDQGLNERRR